MPREYNEFLVHFKITFLFIVRPVKCNATVYHFRNGWSSSRSLARLIHSCQLSVNFLAIRQSLRILPKIEYNAMDLIAFKYTSVL